MTLINDNGRLFSGSVSLVVRFSVFDAEQLNDELSGFATGGWFVGVGVGVGEGVGVGVGVGVGEGVGVAVGQALGALVVMS